MKCLRLLLPFAFVFMLLSAAFFVRAVCDPADTGTPGNDTINCTVANPPAGSVAGGAGDDTITIDAGVTVPGGVSGGEIIAVPEAGNDTIINNGTVGAIVGDNGMSDGSGSDSIVNNGTADYIYGDSFTGDGSGSDAITNNGTVANYMVGDSDNGDGSGSDTIVNNGTVNLSIFGDSIFGTGSGNDTITNNGSASVISGDAAQNNGSGNDSITNNGVANELYGDTALGLGSGSDSITNNGTVNVDIFGDDRFGTGIGSDTITNNGTVGGNIITDGGNDTVVINGNTATVGGTIDGGADYDVLTFSLTSTSPAQMQEWAAQIAAANPAGGTITLAGHTYTWTNFEELTQLLFTMTRLNNIGDPLAVFCSLSDGMDVYAVNGDEGFLSLNVSSQTISNGIAAAVESNTTIQIGSSDEAVVYATAGGDLQVNAPNGFSFNFAYQSFCGALPEARELVVEVEEEELPPFSIINQPYGS